MFKRDWTNALAAAMVAFAAAVIGKFAFGEPPTFYNSLIIWMIMRNFCEHYDRRHGIQNNR